MVGAVGLEPTTPALSTRCSNQLSYAPVIRFQIESFRFELKGWWSQTDSNRRPTACKAVALPAELWPRKNVERPETSPPVCIARDGSVPHAINCLSIKEHCGPCGPRTKVRRELKTTQCDRKEMNLSLLRSPAPERGCST